MSKRIQELAQQFNARIDPSNHYINQDLLEQLIQTVVQDCVAVIAKDLGSGMDHSDFSDGMTWGLRMSINSIKEHFGLER